MADDTAQEKTEQPTGRRLNKARGEGQVAKSQDLSTALLILISLLALAMFGPAMGRNVLWTFRAIIFEIPTINITPEIVSEYCRRGGMFMVQTLGPFVLCVAIVALLANIIQFGFLFTTKSMKFQPSRLMPSNGFKRIFAPRSWAELVKSIIKVIIVGVIGYITIKGVLPQLILLVDQDVYQIVLLILKTALKLAFRVAIAILILGLIDFKFQKWAHKRQLRMSKQEIKDEHKQVEGDPKTKGRQRKIQYQNALNRMIKELPEADVVITNPVHLAVALRYDTNDMSTPKVIAKGRRKIAERIKAIAAEHDIPVVEDPPLARALFKMCEIGMEIPYDLFQAVAEVLAMVYRMKERV